MSEHILEATTREETGRKTEVLRAQGLVPAVVYGDNIEPMKLTVDRNQFVKMYNAAGESSLVSLKVDGKDAIQVLIQDYQQDPLTDFVTHADFRAVDMNKPVEAVAKLEFVGESMAVKGLGGTLVKSLSHVTIKALPSKLVAALEVDLGQLAGFEDVIRAGTLATPEGVEVVSDPNATIASVAMPRTAKQMAALDEAPVEDVNSVEKEGEKKEEEAAA
jgi:large subunit ribosomal protein L25